MITTLALLAASVVGVEPGWEPLEEGGWRYHIQLDPENVEALLEGEPIESDVPPELWDLRSYRITVGDEPVPREPLPDLSARPRRGASGDAGATAGGSALPSRSPSVAVPRTTASSAEQAGNGPPGEVQEERLARPRLDDSEARHALGEPDTPWAAVAIAYSTAFGCFGGMLYAAWIAWDYRRRYRTLFERLIEAGINAEA